MRNLIDYLISQAPEENDGAVEAQLILKNGMQIAGAIRKIPFKSEEFPNGATFNYYCMTTIGQRQTQNGSGGQPEPVAVDAYFDAEDVIMVHIAKGAPSALVIPNRKIMPGLRSQ
jgi:hypothetical protein